MGNSLRQAFAAVCLLAAAACVQTPSASTQAVASDLGLQVFQDGQPVALNASGSGSRRTTAVTLKRTPFELRLPLAAWSAERPDAALQVALSDQPGFADLLRIDAPIADTPYLRRATSMAIPAAYVGDLLSAGRKPDTDGYGHNYLLPEFFSASPAGYRSLRVSRIEERDSEQNLMQAGPLTMVVYLDRQLGPPPKRDRFGILDWIDRREVEVLQITFAD
jgi:hypothetical protein